MVKKIKTYLVLILLFLVVGYTPYATSSLYALELNNDKYHINFVLDDSDTVSYQMEVNSNTLVLESDFPSSVLGATRNGYTLLGFSETRDGTAITSIHIATADKTLYALWHKETYVIQYVLNNVGATYDGVESYSVEDSVVLDAPTANGYTFISWHLDDATLSDSSKIESFDVSMAKNAILYAKWDYATYSISYELNGGENNVDNVSTYKISSLVTLYEPIKIGHIFAGWYKESDFVNKVTSIATGTYGDITLYAKWTPREYNVLFKLPDGTNKIVQNVQYGTKVKVPNLNNAFYEIPMFSENLDYVTGDMVVTVSYLNILLVYIAIILLMVVVVFIIVMNNIKKRNNIRNIRKKYHDKVYNKTRKTR